MNSFLGPIQCKLRTRPNFLNPALHNVQDTAADDLIFGAHTLLKKDSNESL